MQTRRRRHHWLMASPTTPCSITPHTSIRHQTLPRVTDILHFSVVDSLLNYVSDFVINWKPCCSATTKINLAWWMHGGWLHSASALAHDICPDRHFIYYWYALHRTGRNQSISISAMMNSVFVARLYWPSPPFVQFSDYPLRENSVLQELLKCAINHQSYFICQNKNLLHY